jgi:two-component system, chemotaxis family, protein-glutamate methylesterase/glutaminase
MERQRSPCRSLSFSLFGLHSGNRHYTFRTQYRDTTSIQPFTKIPASLVVVQEISPKVLASFVRRFDEYVPWKVEVAEHNMLLEQGVCYISSTEKKMCVKANNKGEAIIAFSESKSKPLDLLFSSASEVFQQNTIGVLLTGVGNDGAEGMADIRKVSGVTLAQEAQTCVYPNLTDHAVKCGVIDIVLNETKLSKAIETIIT